MAAMMLLALMPVILANILSSYCMPGNSQVLCPHDLMDSSQEPFEAGYYECCYFIDEKKKEIWRYLPKQLLFYH